MGTTLRIMITDDSDASRALLAAFLEPLGHELTHCVNGRQAVKTYAKGEFDLILMDVVMPVMDGLAATEAIRELELASGRTPVPVVMLSGNDTPEEIARYARAGVSAFLPKPLSRQELLETVAEATADA